MMKRTAKNHIAKRIMSVLLTLCLTLGVLPAANAAESGSAAMLKAIMTSLYDYA